MRPAMTTESVFCTYVRCHRQLVTLTLDGEVLTISEQASGRLTPGGEEGDTWSVSCERHGYVELLALDALKYNYRCSKIEVTT